MKSMIVAWSVGLFGLCTLAGCNWERAFRNPFDSCRGCCGAGGGSVSSSASAKNQPPRKADGDAARLPPTAVEKAMPSKQAATTRPAPLPTVAKKVVPVGLPAPVALKKQPTLPLLESTPIAPTPLALPPLKDFEQTKPMIINLDKLPPPMVDDTNSPPRSSLTPGTNGSGGANQPENVDARNRLEDKGEKIVSLQSTQIQYGHADSFQQLTGQVQQWRKTWRLRYAAVSADDMYGGSVVLEGLADPSKLRDGQHVQVRGRLIPAERRQDPARYVVQSITLLD